MFNIVGYKGIMNMVELGIYKPTPYNYYTAKCSSKWISEFKVNFIWFSQNFI